MSSSLGEVAKKNLVERLRDNPCRGIFCGMNERGSQIVGHFIMGRSDNSKNRVYVVQDGNDVYTQPADPTKVEDPSLIIYRASTANIPYFVASNGSQTELLAAYRPASLSGPDRDVLDVLRSSHCEPDAPIFTPRISLVLDSARNEVCFSLLRPDDVAKEHWKECVRSSEINREDFKRPGLTEREVTERYNLEIGSATGLDHKAFPTVRLVSGYRLHPGFGLCMTTYVPGSKDLNAFHGEPFLIPMSGKVDEVMNNIWEHLEPEWRVAIAARATHPDIIDPPIVKNRYEQVKS